MSAVKCYRCDADLTNITVESDLIYANVCENCGARRGRVYSVEEWIVILSNRISELERRLTDEYTRRTFLADTDRVL